MRKARQVEWQRLVALMAHLLETASCCPSCKKSLSNLNLNIEKIQCECGKSFPIRNKIPNFIYPEELSPRDAEALHQYDEAAEEYDEMIKWLFHSFHGNETEIRTQLVNLLSIKSGSTVLEVSCGTGSNLTLILDKVGKDGHVAALDLSYEMLKVARKKLGDKAKQVSFVQANAAYIPFCDQTFDRVLHLGGINTFGDMRRAMREMTRITKVGGKIVIGDQGLAPWLMNTKYGKILTRINPLYQSQPPLHLLPENAREVRLHWFIGNAFYLIEFTVGEGPPQLNLDLPLPGRNESIRTLIEEG